MGRCKLFAIIVKIKPIWVFKLSRQCGSNQNIRTNIYGCPFYLKLPGTCAWWCFLIYMLQLGNAKKYQRREARVWPRDLLDDVGADSISAPTISTMPWIWFGIIIIFYLGTPSLSLHKIYLFTFNSKQKPATRAKFTVRYAQGVHDSCSHDNCSSRRSQSRN